MHCRVATLADLGAIMKVEEETFGELGMDAMASRALMESRILLCNTFQPGWFWVTEMNEQVTGYIVLQPTHLLPESCVSWESSTDNGSLLSTYAEDGETIFGVSIATGKCAPPGTGNILLHQMALLWLKTKKKRFMFCSRLPGFEQAHVASGVSATAYWKQTDESGVPVDWLLREFYDELGVLPKRFLPNGFLPDKQSGGHGALVVVDDPFLALQLLVTRIYDAGIKQGIQSSKGSSK